MRSNILFNLGFKCVLCKYKYICCLQICRLIVGRNENLIKMSLLICKFHLRVLYIAQVGEFFCFSQVTSNAFLNCTKPLRGLSSGIQDYAGGGGAKIVSIDRYCISVVTSPSLVLF